MELTEPHLIPSADELETLHDQLDYLGQHVYCGVRGCEDCERFKAVRGLLLAVFAEPKRQKAGISRWTGK